MRVAISLGQLHRHTQRPATRHDRDLVQRIGLGQHRGDDCVPGLVIGAGDALLLAHDQRRALGPHQDLVARA
jgi:hypothetical protein